MIVTLWVDHDYIQVMAEWIVQNSLLEYCTYTRMDVETREMLDIQTINKLELQLNSVIMEKEGCRRGLDSLKAQKINMTDFLVTDALIQVCAMMGKFNLSTSTCTYTMMDVETREMLDIQIISKRELQLNSVNMEKAGCRRGLNSFRAEKINVTELVTDAHIQICAMINKRWLRLVLGGKSSKLK